MYANVVTPCGVVVECSISSRNNEGYVVKTARGDSLCAPSDLLPFGFESISTLFCRPGRHCLQGIVVGVTRLGLCVVQPHAGGNVTDSQSAVWEKGRAMIQRLHPLERTTARELDRIQAGMREAASRLYSLAIGEPWTAEQLTTSPSLLELAPMLTRDKPVPPLSIGVRVRCRRFGTPGLTEGTVTAVKHDITYSIQYDSDGAVESNVLHNDVEPLVELSPQAVTVRMRVQVNYEKGKRGTVISVEKEGLFIVFDSTQHVTRCTVAELSSRRPFFPQALRSDPSILEAFCHLDVGEQGLVRRKDCEDFFAKRESFGVRVNMEQLMDEALYPNATASLDYSTFEYIWLRFHRKVR